MPLLRYFVFVGGALLALLLVAGAGLPTPPAIEAIVTSDDLPTVRIHSDRKLPERVVIDTTQPTIVPPPNMTAQAAAPALPALAAKARVREAFAQVVPQEPKGASRSRPRPQKRRVARMRPFGPQMMLVAQQPRFGFFNTMW